MTTVATVERNTSSTEFFEAAARGALTLRRCSECGALRAARRSSCRRCGSSAADWVEASGDAALVTWARHPGTADHEGWLFGLVQLTEGPWLESRLLDLDDAVLAVGLPLEVAFVAGETGEHYPVFRAADGPAHGSADNLADEQIEPTESGSR